MTEATTMMGIGEIMACLPHRPPFLMIDRIIKMTLGESLVALKNVSMNEPFFPGHFPDKPVMPGVLIIEAMAQASAVLAHKTLAEKTDKKILFLFAGIDNARFKRIVEPGDQLEIEIEFVLAKARMVKVNAKASVAGEIACVAELTSVGKELKS